MFGDNKDEERMWNFMLFKIPATNKEIEEGAPIALKVIAVAGIVALVVWVVVKLL